MNYKNMEDRLFKLLSIMGASITTLALIFILGTIFINSLPSLSLDLFLTTEANSPGIGGGLANAAVGSLILSAFSTILATPLAVGTAIYMKKYARNERLINFFGFMIDALSGTPSIVLGIFGLFFLVYQLRYFTGGFSLISGTIALSILILPVIERAAERAIESVPHELEDASYALGSTKFETLKNITLPYALTGILTGVVIGVGRAAEESAVVILTAGYSQFMPELKVAANSKYIFGVKIYPFQDIIGSLPITVYHSFEFPHMIPRSEGFAAALVLIAMVMIINTTARLIVWRRRIG
jgi:phosphate transport system permease protein